MNERVDLGARGRLHFSRRYQAMQFRENLRYARLIEELVKTT